jgi:predicted component of type VI protein secretion system
MNNELTRSTVAVALKMLTGNSVDIELHVTSPRFMIGRSDDCELRVNSTLVSRRHCVLLVEDGQADLRDLDSLNGTFLNGVLFCGVRRLKTGDQIKVGELLLEVQLVRAASAEQLARLSRGNAALPIDDVLQGDDSDVVDWLHEERRGEVSDTIKMHCSETQIGSASVRAGAAQPPDKQPASHPEACPKKPGTSPRDTKDPQEAAATLLRRYFNRR